MHMYTVNILIKEDSFTLYKDMFFVTVAKCDVGYRNGMLTCICIQHRHSMCTFFIAELLCAESLQVKPHTLKNLVTNQSTIFCCDVTVCMFVHMYVHPYACPYMYVCPYAKRE